MHNNKWSYAHSFRRSTFVFSFFTWCLCCLDLVGSFCFIRIWIDNASVWMKIASVTPCMIVFGLFCFVCSVVWNFHFRINSKIMLTFILFSQHHLFMIYRLLFYVWHSVTVHYWVFFVVIFSASTWTCEAILHVFIVFGLCSSHVITPGYLFCFPCVVRQMWKESNVCFARAEHTPNAVFVFVKQ